MPATAKVFFSRYLPSFWGYVYSRTSFICMKRKTKSIICNMACRPARYSWGHPQDKRELDELLGLLLRTGQATRLRSRAACPPGWGVCSQDLRFCQVLTVADGQAGR